MNAQVTEVTGVLFSRQVRDAIAEYGMDQAPDVITELHRTDVDQIERQLKIVHEEAERAVLSANRGHHFVQQLLTSVTREAHNAAGYRARAELATSILRAIGLAVEDASDGKVPAEELQAILARPLPQEPMRYPYIASFAPSNEFTMGHFVTDDDTVHQVWPFTGWAMVLHSPGDGMNALQAVFAVDGEAVPASTLQLERGLNFVKFS